MKHYRVIITPFAGENIREAHEWLEVENPTYAAKWLIPIFRKFDLFALVFLALVFLVLV